MEAVIIIILWSRIKGITRSQYHTKMILVLSDFTGSDLYSSDEIIPVVLASLLAQIVVREKGSAVAKAIPPDQQWNGTILNGLLS